MGSRGTDRGQLAEGQGFEPWEAFTSLVFKTSAFDRSATPPGRSVSPLCPVASSSECADALRPQRVRPDRLVPISQALGGSHNSPDGGATPPLAFF